MSKIFTIIVIYSLFTTTIYAAQEQDKANISKSQKSLSSKKDKDKPLKEVKKQIKRKDTAKKDINQDLKMFHKQSAQKQRKDSQDINSQKNKIILDNLVKALNKLNHARYNYNPNDTRRQGNMGKVDMLDPYGHDKDSNRMELYGNQGRVIKEPIPEPEPEPELVPEPVPELVPEPVPEPKPEPEPLPEPPPEPPF